MATVHDAHIATNGHTNGISKHHTFNPTINKEPLPPFPDNVPTADHLQRLSYGKLLANDAAEVARFFEACKVDGFFYLDMRDCEEGQKMIREVEQLRDLDEKASQLPMEEKMEYTFEKLGSLLGYKYSGSSASDHKGNKDFTEFFNISRDEVLAQDLSKLSQPAYIKQHQDLLYSYTKSAYNLTIHFLQLLEQSLKLPPNTLCQFHTLDQPSGDHIRLSHNEPKPRVAHDSPNPIALPSHTDFGSITVLFNWAGGLQIVPQNVKGAEGSTTAKPSIMESGSTVDDSTLPWVYMKPIPGHACINLGDALVTFTNGLLKSTRHRVLPSPGAQSELDRYSVVYFLRPADQTKMRILEGGEIPAMTEEQKALQDGKPVLTAKQWINSKARGMAIALGKDAD